MMIYVRYLMMSGLAAISGAALFIAMNYVVDPYRVFSDERVPGFNDQTPDVSARRLFQPLIVSGQPADVIVLGSSRGRGILNAARKYWPDKKIVSASVSALRAHEAAEFLSFYARRSDVTHIIYQPDFFAFNANVQYERNFVPNIVSRGHLWRLNAMALFSVSALHATIRTVLQSRNQKLASTTDLAGDLIPKKERSLREGFAYQLSAYQNNERFYLNFILDQSAFDQLAFAFKTIKSSGKKFTLLLGPSHALQWEAVLRSGHGDAFAEWKRELAKIGATTGVEIWDFANYSRISTLAIAQADNYYSDSSHYTAAAGLFVLRCINLNTDCEPVGGHKLTADNVDGVIRESLQNRARWIKETADSDDWQTLAR